LENHLLQHQAKRKIEAQWFYLKVKLELLGLGKLSTDLRMLKYQILGIVCIDEK
jgi:hypothetical protein